jgi:hypothetical protein
MHQKFLTRRSLPSIAFLISVTVGTVTGFIMSNVISGILIGMGTGFIAMAILRFIRYAKIRKERKDQKDQRKDDLIT